MRSKSKQLAPQIETVSISSEEIVGHRRSPGPMIMICGPMRHGKPTVTRLVTCANPDCGREFATTSGRAKLCCDECKAANNRRWQREKWAKQNKVTGTTKAEYLDREAALFAIIQKQKPMTVRQVFYQAVNLKITEKTETGYKKIQRQLVEMRKEGHLPYDWIIDGTRSVRQWASWDGVAPFLEQQADRYRKDLWAGRKDRVQIWLEKDALAGVVSPVVDEYGVPLVVARGYASESLIFEAAQNIDEFDGTTFVYHLGDYDQFGTQAGEKIEDGLKRLAISNIVFERVALMPDQIDKYNLPTRPTKGDDARARAHGDLSTELDALPPDILRQIVRRAIERHMPQRTLKRLRKTEAQERDEIQGLIEQIS